MDISLINILLLLIPLLILVWSLKFFRIYLLNQTIISVIRMVLQLLLVGVYLEYIFKFDNPIINLAYILVMLSVAAFSTIEMTNLNYKKLILPILTSMFLSWFIVYTVYEVVVLPKTGYFDARYMVPVSGMLMGNILKGQIILLNNLFRDLKENETSYFYLLSMGATKLEALKGFYKTAISSAIKPDLGNMATIGLVSLPGMMTGQILAGASPFTAIKYQISIMIAIFSIRIISLVFTVFIINKVCFDGFSRLKKDIFR
ncbi:MAG: ABC transporter permease [Fusobacteria bacterium]|nr:MAG: ABC transporter permease [Fusobacteriota bacterium]